MVAFALRVVRNVPFWGGLGPRTIPHSHPQSPLWKFHKMMPESSFPFMGWKLKFNSGLVYEVTWALKSGPNNNSIISQIQPRIASYSISRALIALRLFVFFSIALFRNWTITFSYFGNNVGPFLLEEPVSYNFLVKAGDDTERQI